MIQLCHVRFEWKTITIICFLYWLSAFSLSSSIKPLTGRRERARMGGQMFAIHYPNVYAHTTVRFLWELPRGCHPKEGDCQPFLSCWLVCETLMDLFFGRKLGRTLGRRFEINLLNFFSLP